MRVTDVSVTKDGPLDPRLNWAALSQAERDAAYDNNAAVKNSARADCRKKPAVRNPARQPQILS
jgi:hypothetical protein